MGGDRGFRLLWVSQALSGFGANATLIAFPLLVLASTGSATVSGLVLGTVAGARLVAGLPGGVLVDRWDRKRVMIGCEAAYALALSSLVLALCWGVVRVAHLVVVAAVLGVCAALFEPAEDASLPRLVPEDRLPSAVALVAARSALGHLSGTAAGGFLFALGRLVPFAADLVSHLASMVLLLFLRVPGRPDDPADDRPAAASGLGREMLAGLRWVWRQPHLRITAGCAVVLNLFFSAFYVVVIVLTRRAGVPTGQIGLMAAMLGLGGLIGALIAPRLGRRLRPYLSIVSVFWVLTLLTPAAIVLRAGTHVAGVSVGYLMGALFFMMALLPPTANTTIVSTQLMLTPDRLRGRLASVTGLVTGVAATIGPAVGGALAQAVPASTAVGICTLGMATVTILLTVSPSLRRFPGGEPPISPEYQLSPTNGGPTMDDDARYEVLRNDEDQYSLWAAGHEVPAGWYPTGTEGTRDECSAYVDEVWTDMRPRSLREQMAAQESDPAGS